MLLKVRKNTNGEIVLRNSTPDEIRLCGKVDPTNDSADYVGRFDITGFPFECSHDSVAKYSHVVGIKKGNKGQVIKYDHIRDPEWVKVVFRLDDGTDVRGYVPITRLAIGTRHLLEDWLDYCKQDNSRQYHASATGPLESNPANFIRVPVANEMDVYFGRLSTVTEIETNDAVNQEKDSIKPKRKLYYSKRSDGHSDGKHDLYLTTSADVGPPPGTHGYFIAEIMRYGKPHPYRYCTTGDFWMWSIEPMAKVVAFAFMYKTDDGWSKMYFRGRNLRLLKNDVRRSFSYIFIASSFVMFLHRVPIPNRWLHITWMPSYGIADVWNLYCKYSDIDQEYIAIRETRTITFAPMSNLLYRPRVALRAHLNRLGCLKILSARTTKVKTRGWRSRNSCNLSQIKFVLADLAARREEHSETGEQLERVRPYKPKRRPCDLCQVMGLDCAFERDIRLFTKNKATDELTYAETLMRDLAPLHWLPDFDPNPIMDATFLGLATGMTV